MRYFFNVRDAVGMIPDEEGSDLSGIMAARLEAVDSARDFAMDDLRCGNPVQARSIEITDQDGAILETVLVRDIAGTPLN
jgi:hypothetical protein